MIDSDVIFRTENYRNAVDKKTNRDENEENRRRTFSLFRFDFELLNDVIRVVVTFDDDILITENIFLLNQNFKKTQEKRVEHRQNFRRFTWPIDSR